MLCQATITFFQTQSLKFVQFSHSLLPLEQLCCPHIAKHIVAFLLTTGTAIPSRHCLTHCYILTYHWNSRTIQAIQIKFSFVPNVSSVTKLVKNSRVLKKHFQRAHGSSKHMVFK